MKFSNIFGHLHTIGRHRRMVRRYCFRLGLYWQGLTHDLSKYTPAELIPGFKYYLGTKSPAAKEREIIGYSEAWMHHKGRNRHHYEYWTDYVGVPDKHLAGVPMPPKYFAEMVCDRIAASRNYNREKYHPGMPLEYFNRANEHQLMMNRETADLLEKVLIMVRDEGEDKAFDFVKHEILKK